LQGQPQLHGRKKSLLLESRDVKTRRAGCAPEGSEL
jgi:hypothetical protein